jgi:hypothetical protein
MNKIILIIAGLVVSAGAFAQNNEMISLGAGYSNQSFYSFTNGEVANVDNTNWDIAFSVSGMGSAIRVNGGYGLELYTYPNGDINDWSSLDTVGMSSWSSQINSDESWNLGAFDQNADENEAFDLGWGIYSMITHYITGDSLHVLKWADGTTKKFQVIQLASGTYSFRCADIDGSNEVESSVVKSDFSGKNFAYYSIMNNEVLDREPLSESWDLIFTKYVTELYPGMNYGVTGVLSNAGYSVAKAEDVPVADADYLEETFEEEINTIGYDWKSFNMDTYLYDLQEDLSYFVRKDATSEIWKINFTSFAGSSSGDIEFTTESISTLEVAELNSSNTFTLYPNPCKQRVVNLIYEISSDELLGSGTVLDMNGLVVYDFSLENGGLRNKKLNLEHLAAGAYIVCYNYGTTLLRQKLILN